MDSSRLFKNTKLVITGLIFFGFSSFSTVFAQDLYPGHTAYNSLTSVVDAMKLERKSCAEIGYYPQVGQSICASVSNAETFRDDWDMIVSTTGTSFGLSPLGQWTSEPARGIISRTYLLGATDLMVNYDVISSRVTIDVLDPELQAEEAARQRVQAEADAAQQQAQLAYDQQQNAALQASQTVNPQNTHVAQGNLNATQANSGSNVVAATVDYSTTYPKQVQTTEITNGYVATNEDSTTFVLATEANTVTAHTATVDSSVQSRAYAPATQTTAQTNTANGYASTTTANYQQAATYQQATTQATDVSPATTIAYAYTPTNLITAVGATTQNSMAFQPSGAWQITSSGNPVTIHLYDTQTQSFLRTVYSDQIYVDTGSYYLSIQGNQAWALSVWTE